MSVSTTTSSNTSSSGAMISRLARWAGRRYGAVLTALAILIFIGWFASLAIALHNAWLTFGYDLGNADQALWNTAHGRLLQFTNWVGKDDWFKAPTRLAMHVEPVYLLLAPLYWLWDDVRGLLILQVVALALGAVPAYLLARRQLNSQGAGAVFAAVYLLNSGIHWLTPSDFHAVALATPLLLAAYLCLIERRNLSFAVFAVLAMSTKENVPLAVAGMGAWAFLVQKRRRLGLITMVVGVIWFVAAVFVVIPAFSKQDGSPFLAYYAQQSTGGLIQGVLDTLLGPRALTYVVNWLVAFAFLPLLSPLALLPALPDLAINLLSDNPAMYTFGRHYVAVVVPIAVVAAILGMANLWRWTRQRRPAWLRPVQIGSLAVLVLAALLAPSRFPVTPLSRGFGWPEMTAAKRKLPAFAALIPADASVCAANNLNSHFSHRERLYLLPYTLECEYAILHVPSAQFLGSNAAGENDLWRKRLLDSGSFGVVAADDGLLLLQRGAQARLLPDTFYDFARPAMLPKQMVQQSGRFGDAIELVGYYAEPRDAQPPQLHLYFKALRSLPEDYMLRAYLVEEPGTLLAATEHTQPWLVWYPTSQWQPGQVVEIVASSYDWSIPLDPSRDYSLAIGWGDSADAWNPAKRLVYTGGDEDTSPRRFQGDTLVYVASFDSKGDVSIPARDAPLPPETVTLDARLGDGIRLGGFELATAAGQTDAVPGETVRLRLYWQVDAPPGKDLTVFAHLLDASGQVVAQGDSPPLAGSWPTSRWRAGDLVADLATIALPPDLPAGDYVLAVGLYDPQTGQRLPVTGKDTDSAALSVRLPIGLRVQAQ